MRIDSLVIKNFKGYSERTFEFAPSFNLLVGPNGVGKTSALDALAVTAGSWLLGVRGYDSRHFYPSDVRLAPRTYDGEFRFEEQYPIEIIATGQVLGSPCTWSRSLSRPKGRSTTGGALALRRLAASADKQVRDGEPVTLPLISYYGTGRLWLEPRHNAQVKNADKLAKKRELSRLEGYKNSVDPRLSVSDLVRWIARHSWISYQQGHETSVFRMVKKAILDCVEDAENLYFDPKRGEVVVVMKEHGPQPFSNLSDGQRTMLAMIGDIAQKATKLNPQFGDKVLQECPGVVLIDELDLHLHPRWQRHVIHDLKSTFPKIQFFATTHSPQIVGQALAQEVILLDTDSAVNPAQAYGMDTNWILKHLMGAESETSEMRDGVSQIRQWIEANELEKARKKLQELRSLIQGDRPDLAEAAAAIDRIERLRQ